MLQIGDKFSLPDETVTQTFAILAKRGVGKTYTGAVMTEEMIKAGFTVCVIDPVGVWWGLRASADGKGPGLPVAVLGGEHGDLPLTEDMGNAVADLLVEARVPMVLDLSLLPSKAAVSRFMTAFAERLYHRNREAVHLMIDEADAFAPQRTMKGQERMLGAMESLVRRGRARGIGVTMITQRPAVLNKNVLTQIEVLFAMRTTSPHDRNAVDDWAKANGTPEQREQLMGSLPKLGVGEAWIWSPGWLGLDEMFRVNIRQRETFDSSATPKVGQKVQRPDVLAEVDLGKLKSALASSIEQAEQTDVKALQRKVTDLQKQLRKAEKDADKRPEVKVERVEVPVIPDAQIDDLKSMAEQMMAQAQDLIRCSQDIMQMLGQAQARKPATRPPSSPPSKPVRRTLPRQAEPPDGAISIKAGATRMLAAMARFYPDAISRDNVAALAGMSPKSGTFTSYLSSLRNQGLMVDVNGDCAATEAGVNYLGDDVPALPQTIDEMLDLWRGSLKLGAYRMLTVLVDHYPVALTRDELALESEMSASSGTFTSYLSKLRKNGLIAEPDGLVCAGDSLFALENGV